MWLQIFKNEMSAFKRFKIQKNSKKNLKTILNSNENECLTANIQK